MGRFPQNEKGVFMLIRDIDRSLLPRIRSNKGKEQSPLRKAAEGLGSFLDRLSESVRESRTRAASEQQGDTVDSGIKAHSRIPMRTFKWPSPQEEGAAAAATVELGLSDQQNQTVDKLREARDITSDATSFAMSFDERTRLQEHIKQLFTEISDERINVLSSMFSDKSDTDSYPFSIMNPDSAKASYSAIDKMIMRFLEVETGSGTDSVSTGREAVLSATEQLREFLISEGPANAFARFREINRDNVLGLIQQ